MVTSIIKPPSRRNPGFSFIKPGPILGFNIGSITGIRIDRADTYFAFGINIGQSQLEYSRDQGKSSPRIRYVADKKRQPDNCSQCVAQKNRFPRTILFAHENREKGKEYARYGDNISHVSDGDIVYEKYHAASTTPIATQSIDVFLLSESGAKECNINRGVLEQNSTAAVVSLFAIAMKSRWRIG